MVAAKHNRASLHEVTEQPAARSCTPTSCKADKQQINHAVLCRSENEIFEDCREGSSSQRLLLARAVLRSSSASSLSRHDVPTLLSP
jgi:hypothetical protein